MTYLDATILALVQAACEFLPVSSSGHLRLAAIVMDIDGPNTAFDVWLHLGTLLAVVVFYRKRLLSMVTALVRWVARKTPHDDDARSLRLVVAVVVASIPAVLTGLFLGDAMEALTMQAWVVGTLLVVNGLVLLSTRIKRPQRKSGPLTMVHALVVGVAQAFAIFRGISRSGSTITAALHLGRDAEEAAELSFIMSIPVILGAAVLEARHADIGGSLGVYSLGGVVAFVAGLAFLTLLVRLVKRGGFHHFGWYTIALGVAAIIFDMVA